MQTKKGFTLIELLIVIGIISILAAIIYVAVNPAKRLQQARDAERWSSVNAILNAVLKYTVDNNGGLPTKVDAMASNAYHVIGTGGVDNCADCDAVEGEAGFNNDCLDINNGAQNELVDEYLAEIPVDPDADLWSDAETGYYIRKSGNGRITIGACVPEIATEINVSR